MNRGEEWENARKSAFKRDDGECQDCGKMSDPLSILHVHHKTPRSEGGSDDLENLVTLCPDCHAQRHGVEACTTCGGVLHDGYYDKQVFDDDGAVLVSICDDCWNVLQNKCHDSGCSICGTGIDGRSEFSVATMRARESQTLCEKCRRHLIMNTRGYFQMVPIDFRHWKEVPA